MSRMIMAALIAFTALGAAPALADSKPVLLAAENCFAVGQQVAADRGATLASAEAVTKDGQTMCKVVLLIPGESGQRPRREEIVVNP
jgi:hypothetical protein